MVSFDKKKIITIERYKVCSFLLHIIKKYSSSQVRLELGIFQIQDYSAFTINKNAFSAIIK